MLGMPFLVRAFRLTPAVWDCCTHDLNYVLRVFQFMLLEPVIRDGRLSVQLHATLTQPAVSADKHKDCSVFPHPS